MLHRGGSAVPVCLVPVRGSSHFGREIFRNGYDPRSVFTRSLRREYDAGDLGVRGS